MAQQVITTMGGAFTPPDIAKINDNFTEIFQTQIGGALDAGKIIVGDNTDAAAAVDMSGDATIDDTGAVTISNTAVNKIAVVDLSADDIITLHSVPVTIVADPGAGNAVVVDSFDFSMTYGSVQFTGGGAVQCQYHGDTTNICNTTISATPIKAAADFCVSIGRASTAGGVVVLGHKAVELIAASADFAAGDSTAKVTVNYRIIAL